MRYLASKSNLGVLILAALTAGTGSLPAVAARSSQTGTAPAHKSSATQHKKASTASAHPSTTAAAKKPAATTPSKSTTPSTTKSASSTHRKASTRTRAKKVKGQQAPTSDRINEIQEALASKGVFTGTPSGKWDDSTVEAMKQFQTRQGLAPSGKLDALTLQKLGLGSQTAGLGTPKAPPNSTNRLRNAPSVLEEPVSTEEPRN